MKRNPIKTYIYKSLEESFETQDSKVEIQFLNFEIIYSKFSILFTNWMKPYMELHQSETTLI
jgi:hypothetical protein